MGKTARWILGLLLAALLLVPVLPSWAGEGDGSGGGQGQPLELVSSSPADGQSDVVLSAEIKLTFNKNVVYMTVRDRNSKCLALYSQDGIEVPVDVVMADDQVESEKKRDIIIKPRQELQAGTKYTVKVAPQLEAKSGASLGKEVKISFTTEEAEFPTAETASSTSEDSSSMVGEVSESSQGDRSDPAEQTASSNSASKREQEEGPGNIKGSNEEDVSREADQSGSTAGEKPMDNQTETDVAADQGINIGILVVAAIVLIAVLAYLVIRKKGK